MGNINNLMIHNRFLGDLNAKGKQIYYPKIQHSLVNQEKLFKAKIKNILKKNKIIIGGNNKVQS